jgi:CDP-diacylglycerol--glycerol-3-phosphate 3-phosphatidyltransferase
MEVLIPPISRRIGGAMTKNIPNILSAMRILLSFLLLFTQPFSVWFIVLYLICGLSDMFDGYLARKWSVTSPFGARLDSMGDFLMLVIVCYKLIPYLDLKPFILLWIVLIAGIRFVSGFVSFMKYHSFVFLHTYANKASGFLLFSFPLLFLAMGIEIAAVLLCMIATISAAEELLIQILSSKLNQDIISIFHL